MIDQPDRPVARQLWPDAYRRALGLDVHAQRGEPVPEAPVDRLLRRPQRRHRLAALAHVAELCLHHPPEEAPTPVRRQDPDHRDPGTRDRAARQRQLERIRARARDDATVVEHREHALEREQLRESLGVLVGGLPAEVVADGADGGLVFLEIADGANAMRHWPDPRCPAEPGARQSFSSGA